MENNTLKQMSRVDYFHNEQGDFTITLYDEPIAFTKDEESAHRLVNSFKSLTLRIDTLSKMSTKYKERVERLEKSLKTISTAGQLALHSGDNSKHSFTELAISNALHALAESV